MRLPHAHRSSGCTAAHRPSVLPLLHSLFLQGVVSCLEREAGYILLGALCAARTADLLAGKRSESLLALFEPALGAEAATELDRRYCSNVVRTACVDGSECMQIVSADACCNVNHGKLPSATDMWTCWNVQHHAQVSAPYSLEFTLVRLRPFPPLPLLQSNLDHVVAVELWWRTAALQALLACIAGPLAAAPRTQQPALHRRAAALLKPTLDVLTAHAALQVREREEGDAHVFVVMFWCVCWRHSWLAFRRPPVCWLFCSVQRCPPFEAAHCSLLSR